MFSNLQISRTLVGKSNTTMNPSNKTVSTDALQAEWQEIQAAQQNPALFRPLYDRYFDPIFRFVYRRCNDESRAADLTSQVFLKAMQKLPKYEYKGVPFSAWLYRIASNEVTQYFRDNKKNRVVSLEKTQINDIVEEIDGPNKEELKKAMFSALDQLKEGEIQLIEMRFFEQRPFKEIADILEITESNAKVKTYRTLEKLKKIILQQKK